jgi:hypothetical protein
MMKLRNVILIVTGLLFISNVVCNDCSTWTNINDCAAHGCGWDTNKNICVGWGDQFNTALIEKLNFLAQSSCRRQGESCKTNSECCQDQAPLMCVAEACGWLFNNM